MDNIETMTSLVHELGHIVDIYNFKKHYPNNQLIMYGTIFSPYIEVESKRYEKDFLEYLIKNNIYPGNAKYQLESYYSTILDSSEFQYVLSLLDNKYLKNNRFNKIPNNILINNIIKKDITSINLEEYDDIKNASTNINVCYTYGGAIATYLSYLKKNDLDKFQRVHQKFENHKNNLFNPKIFGVLETSPNSINKIIKKEMKVLEKKR